MADQHEVHRQKITRKTHTHIYTHIDIYIYIYMQSMIGASIHDQTLVYISSACISCPFPEQEETRTFQAVLAHVVLYSCMQHEETTHPTSHLSRPFQAALAFLVLPGAGGNKNLSGSAGTCGPSCSRRKPCIQHHIKADPCRQCWHFWSFLQQEKASALAGSGGASGPSCTRRKPAQPPACQHNPAGGAAKPCM